MAIYIFTAIIQIKIKWDMQSLEGQNLVSFKDKLTKQVLDNS